MALILVVIVALSLYLLGRYLVRSLGWPRSVEDAVKWAASLFAVALVTTAVPEFVDRIGSRLGPYRSVGVGQLVVVVTFIGLGVLGYVAWERGKDGRAEAPRLQPRRRALPPPPIGGAQKGEGEDVFAVLDPKEDD